MIARTIRLLLASGFLAAVANVGPVAERAAPGITRVEDLAPSLLPAPWGKFRAACRIDRLSSERGGECGRGSDAHCAWYTSGPVSLREAPVHVLPVTEPLRYIAPWHPCPITIEHGLDEQSIVRCGHPDRTFPPGHQVFDPFPLVVAQSEPPHHRSAPYKLTAYESKKSPRRNRLRSTCRRLTADCGNRDSPAQPHGGRTAPTGRNWLIDDRP
jgi:hypothetical protein